MENGNKSEKEYKITHIDLRKATPVQIEKYINELDEYNNKMEDFLDSQRTKFDKEIKDLFIILASKNYKDFLDLQSKSFYMQKLTKSNSLYKKTFGERTEYYLTGFGIKTSDSIKTKLIERDMCEKNRNVKLLENHIEHLRECRNECDQIGYAIKNLIGLINFIGTDR